MRAMQSLTRWTALCVAISVQLFIPERASPQAPDTPPSLTLHAETRVVQIDVVVTDSHGKPVGDLAKQDFTVFDEGKPRAISIFSINRGEVDLGQSPPSSAAAAPQSHSSASNVFSNRDPGPPAIPGHSTVILLDETNAWFENVAWARQGVVGLLGKVEPDERIAVYVIARKLGLVLLQDYTTDHELLLRSLDKYTPRGTSPCMEGPGLPCHAGGDKGQQEDRQAEAIAREKEFLTREDAEAARLSLQALADHLSLVPGRKSVFWVTQGFPPREMREMGGFAWEKTITALNEANVAVNTVDSNGLSGFKRLEGAGSVLSMQQVAEETGGQAYFGRNDLDAAMAEGIDASRVTYSLGFYLADHERDNKFHDLNVKSDRTGLRLLYRQGYYAGNTELPAEKRGKGDPESVLLNQVNSADVGITAKADAKAGTPRATIDLHLSLDLATLSLKQQPSGWVGKIEETFMELNDGSEMLAKISDVKEFAFAAADRARYDREGVAWLMSIPFADGATKVTIVVRDSNSGRVGSLAIPLANRLPSSP